MNDHQTPSDDFEERLLRELRRVVAEGAIATSDVSSPAPRRRARFGTMPRLAVGAGAGAAALTAIAVGLPLGGDGDGGTAYAVTKNGDGTVTVEIDELSDAPGLERELEGAGVNAVVEYLPPGKACADAGNGAIHEVGTAEMSDDEGEPRAIEGGTLEAVPATDAESIPVQGVADAAGEGPTTMGVSFAEGKVELSIDASNHPNEALLIRAHGTPGNEPTAAAVSMAFVEGDARPCEVVDD